MATTKTNRYAAIIERIFFSKYTKGDEELTFEREDLVRAAESLRIALPKNLGDVIYSIRYRTALPRRILETQPKGKEWIQCRPTGNMLKTTDFIGDLKRGWRFNRHTPSHSVRSCQKALILDGFHAFSVG